MGTMNNLVGNFELNKSYHLDCREGLSFLPDQSIDMCVTSPPYFGLRDYQFEGQIGLEKNPEEYISKLVDVFRGVHRVLRDDGTLWINIGDSYAGSGKGWGGKHRMSREEQELHDKTGFNTPSGCKAKDLIGIPWMLAFALRADGWYLRQEIIWNKTNPMPESVKDRCTKAHEQIFLLSKKPHYYFDSEAISEPVSQTTQKRLSQNLEAQQGSFVPGKTNGAMKAVGARYRGKKYTENPDIFNRTKSGGIYDYRPTRNKRSVWTMSTANCKEAHFATFPENLVMPCILAGSKEQGIVLDVFGGLGTTGKTAYKLGRNFILFEGNADYCKLANQALTPITTQERLFL